MEEKTSLSEKRRRVTTYTESGELMVKDYVFIIEDVKQAIKELREDLIFKFYDFELEPVFKRVFGEELTNGF